MRTLSWAARAMRRQGAGAPANPRAARKRPLGLTLGVHAQHSSRPSTAGSAETLTTRRLIIGISGASGIVYGVRLLEVLRDTPIETHLVMTRSAEVTLAYELARKVAEIHALADIVHRADDMGAAISSGSFRTAGMIVAPARSAA